jgi:hypothetical protein
MKHFTTSFYFFLNQVRTHSDVFSYFKKKIMYEFEDSSFSPSVFSSSLVFFDLNFSTEYIYVVLFTDYRRVTVEVDMRNIIMRKFLERCGFIMESVMRKHRVVDNRNRDTAVYVTLNSDWDQMNVKLKKVLGLGLTKKMHKVAEIEESSSSSGGRIAAVDVVVEPCGRSDNVNKSDVEVAPKQKVSKKNKKNK